MNVCDACGGDPGPDAHRTRVLSVDLTWCPTTCCPACRPHRCPLCGPGCIENDHLLAPEGRHL